jgi:hypothetical protein
LLIASYATDSPAPPRLPSNGWAKLKKSWCGKRNTGAAEWIGVGVDELLISTPDGELLQLTTSIAVVAVYQFAVMITHTIVI